MSFLFVFQKGYASHLLHFPCEDTINNLPLVVAGSSLIPASCTRFTSGKVGTGLSQTFLSAASIRVANRELFRKN